MFMTIFGPVMTNSMKHTKQIKKHLPQRDKL